MTMKYLWLSLAFAMPLVTVSCNKVEQVAEKAASSGELTMAKSTFEALTRGDFSAEKSIDWEMLKIEGKSLGPIYMQLPTETEKELFRRNTITGFATGFQSRGATADVFTNWRVVSHDDVKTEVAADSPGGALAFIVTKRNDEKRVSGIEFIPSPAPATP